MAEYIELIDRDALKAKQQKDADLFINAYTLMEKSRRDEALNAVANIVNAPTIIEAEEGETYWWDASSIVKSEEE